MHKLLLLTFLFGASCTLGISQTTFTGKPMYDIQVKRAGTYVGTIGVELFPAIAPNHVWNFDSLVATQFYDSTAFHRVIPGFMIQGGDPNSRSGPISTWGNGDPSQPTVDAEFSAARHLRGIVSAARDQDTNSANSQFFICVAPASWLNGQYTVYGRVTSGMNIVDTVVNEPRDANDNPFLKMEIFVSANGSNDTLARVPVLNVPANNSFGASTSRALSWGALSDGIIYNVQVSTDSTFATTFRSIDVGVNNYFLSGLTSGNTYYWRVNCNNGGDTSAYSTVWHFTTSATGIESYVQESPVLVAPNPSSGQFVFSNLEERATIAITDISGRIIETVITQGPSWTIDLSEYITGMYFYSIAVQNQKVQQGKLLVE